MSASKRMGKQSVRFDNPPVIKGWASVAGKKEAEGPLGKYFDITTDNDEFGGENWEDAESRMQMSAVVSAIDKAKLKKDKIQYIVAGDLLGQLMATSFGIKSLEIPLFGVYGACSTMGESISIASMLIDGKFADDVIAVTSSHFATAEKQFRFPLAYGNQRPLSATTTVTGSGAVVLSSDNITGPHVCVTGITTGMIVDFGIKDANNMGAAMAPAAYKVILANATDHSSDLSEYDKIITGDLGMVGKSILIDMLMNDGYDIRKQYMDCGIEIYNRGEQDAHSGGSGCGCSAITLCGYIMNQLLYGDWKKILFVPTGALLSSVSAHEGNSIPGIAHAVELEVRNK